MPDASQHTPLQQMRELAVRMGDYIALFEEAARKIEEHEVLSGRRLEATEHYFKDRIDQIDRTTLELGEVMSQAGAARWRVAAEAALQQGDQHLAELRQVVQGFQQITQQNYHHLQQTVENCAEQMRQMIQTIPVDNLQTSVNENVQAIKMATDQMGRRVQHWSRWFHWERVGIVLAITVLVSFLMSLYVTDEFPWESHSQVVAQRSAGKILLSAWPHLSMHDKTDIRLAARV